MRLSDIQPQYFPRLHYFARMLESDVFVIRDDVQFVRNHKYPDGTRGVSFQAHTPIRTAQGKHLLPVPVTKGIATIEAAQIAYDQPWSRKHLNIIRNNYQRAPNAGQLLPELDALLAHRFPSVAALNTATTCWALLHLLEAGPVTVEMCTLDRINTLLAERPLGSLTRVALGSEIADHDPDHDLSASERIVDLCQTFMADTYIGGKTAIDAYLETERFDEQGIRLAVQDWRCERYPQQHADQGEFIPDLSILDLLMNVPPVDRLGYLINAAADDALRTAAV